MDVIEQADLWKAAAKESDFSAPTHELLECALINLANAKGLSSNNAMIEIAALQLAAVIIRGDKS